MQTRQVFPQEHRPSSPVRAASAPSLKGFLLWTQEMPTCCINSAASSSPFPTPGFFRTTPGPALGVAVVLCVAMGLCGAERGTELAFFPKSRNFKTKRTHQTTRGGCDKLLSTAMQWRDPPLRAQHARLHPMITQSGSASWQHREVPILAMIFRAGSKSLGVVFFPLGWTGLSSEKGKVNLVQTDELPEPSSN